MKRILNCLLGLTCLAATARADVVTLKNGDRVTGSMVTVRGGNLQLKSDIMGNLTIPMAQVATFSAAKPVAVVIKGQEPVQGALELSPSGDWQVTANGKAQTIAAAKVDVIMPADTYQTLVVGAPKPWQAWKGTAGLGYNLQRGNQQTNTFTTTINGVRERPEAPIFKAHWRTNYGFMTLLSHAEQKPSVVGGAVITVTSRTLTTSVRQDYLFSPGNFLFGLAQLDHVSTEGLYLRQTYGGGFGHDVISNSHTTFSLLGGMTFVHEKFFAGSYTQSAAALAGERLGMQLTKRTRLDHNLNFYPNLSTGGQYRFDTSTSFSYKLSNRLALNTSAIDLYLSNPPPGNRKNNITFSTGIGYTF
jgi:putative salt-induced outer membrane protein YdiY